MISLFKFSCLHGRSVLNHCYVGYWKCKHSLGLTKRGAPALWPLLWPLLCSSIEMLRIHLMWTQTSCTASCNMGRFQLQKMVPGFLPDLTRLSARPLIEHLFILQFNWRRKYAQWVALDQRIAFQKVWQDIRRQTQPSQSIWPH